MMQSKVMSFGVYPFEEKDSSVLAIAPRVNDVPLSQLTENFESVSKFEPAGGYAGLTPTSFKYGALEGHFLGEFESGSYWARTGRCIRSWVPMR